MTITPFPNDFKGDVITPSHPEYEASIVRWAKNAQKNAKIVAFVKDENDVVLAIKYAKANNLPLAVHCGGHSAAGASSIEGGLVIDLARYMNYCRVDAEKKVAYVGGGSVWKTVDAETIKHGLATVAGTISHTGVGGLALGGGYGWLTGEHGLTVDNIAGHRIVTPDGQILNANANENPDLYWGLLGGGGNFGVVTEFIFKVHPQRKTVYFGRVAFPATALESIAKLMGEWWQEGLGQHEGAAIVLTMLNGKPVVLMLMFYNGTEEEGRARFKRFFDLGPLSDDTKEIPFELLNSYQDHIFDYGRCVYLNGTGHGSPNYETLKEVHQRVIKLAGEIDQLFPAVLLDYPSLKKVLSVPKEATPFRREDKAYVGFVFMYPENQPENLVKCRNASNDLKEIFKRGQPNLTDAQSLGYSNLDFDYTSKDRSAQVFGEHYPRLQQLKKKYDPEERFSKWFPILPAN